MTKKSMTPLLLMVNMVSKLVQHGMTGCITSRAIGFSWVYISLIYPLPRCHICIFYDVVIKASQQSGQRYRQ